MGVVGVDDRNRKRLSDGGRETERGGERQRATEMGERHPRLRGDKHKREERQKNGSDGDRREKGKEKPCEERDRDKERDREGDKKRKLGDRGLGIEGDPEEADGVGEGLAPRGT